MLNETFSVTLKHLALQTFSILDQCVTLQIEKLSNRRTKKKLYSIHPSIQILFVYVVFVLTWCLIIPKKKLVVFGYCAPRYNTSTKCKTNPTMIKYRPSLLRETWERESRGAKTAFYQNQPYQRAAARRVRMWRIFLVFSIFIPSSRFFVGFPQRSFAVFEHNLKCLILKKSWKIFVEEQLCNRNFFEQKKFEKIITIFFFFFFFFFFI